MHFRAFILLVSLFALAACQTNADEGESVKQNVETIAASSKSTDLKLVAMERELKAQVFEIETGVASSIETVEGIVAIIPENTFVDAHGKAVGQPVSIEIKEAFSFNDMLLSGLTTTTNGELLESDGMFHIKAESQGKPVFIDPNNPIYFEIPTSNFDPEMMVFEGEVDEHGNINWTNPKEIQRYLTLANQTAIDYLPPSFEETAYEYVPNHWAKRLDEAMLDSLYYSLHTLFDHSNSANDSLMSDEKEIVDGGQLNEAFYNRNAEVKNGRHTKDSFNSGINYERNDLRNAHYHGLVNGQGVDPASIKAIRDKKFKNSLLSTREFEARLPELFKLCGNEFLEFYIENLDKNLWEIDQMVADRLEGDKKDVFQKFANKKDTKIREADRYSEALKNHYRRELSYVKRELKRLQKKKDQEDEKANAAAERKRSQYRKILWKREKYRMTKFGFKWSETGWVSLGKSARSLLQETPAKHYEVTVKNGVEMDRVHTYFVYTSIQSIYRLNRLSEIGFVSGNTAPFNALMPTKGEIVALSVGYKGEGIFIGSERLSTDEDEYTYDLTLQLSNKQELRTLISEFDRYKRENSIALDLTYQKEFFKEKLRRKRNISEKLFSVHLASAAFPCGEFSISY